MGPNSLLVVPSHRKWQRACTGTEEFPRGHGEQLLYFEGDRSSEQAAQRVSFSGDYSKSACNYSG